MKHRMINHSARTHTGSIPAAVCARLNVKYAILAFVFVGSAFFAVTSRAVTVEYRDGVDILVDGVSTGILYNGTHDTEIRATAPGVNFDLGTGSSSEPEFTVDLSDGGGEAQVVMRFDNIFGPGAGQIPSGSIITSATLFIDIDNTGADLELYELTTGFGNESVATWSTFGAGVVPGVNAAASPLAIINGGGNKETIDVTASVAAWAAGTTNFGWAFIATGSDGVDFDASENPDFADRPMLTIDFTTVSPAVVPLPPSLLLCVPALAVLYRKSHRKAGTV